ITQQDYFRFFALFNNTEDADLKDESPLLELYTAEQKAHRDQLKAEISRTGSLLKTSTEQLKSEQRTWEEHFPREREWVSLKPANLKARDGGAIQITTNGAFTIAPQQRLELYTLELPLSAGRIAGLRIEALQPDIEPAS